MKKLALLVLVVVVLGIGSVYYFIPDTLVVTALANANCVPDAAFRNMSDQAGWARWWPVAASAGTGNAGDTVFRVGKYKYSLSKKLANNFEILIASDKDTLRSEINLLSLPHDSTLIKWHFSIPAGSNIIGRITAYSKASSLKKELTTILNNLQAYLSNFSNLYGFTLKQASIKDTFLISTKSFSANYPTTELVYQLADKLKNFGSSNGAMVTGVPMLNITTVSPSGYSVMVAIHVNHVIQGKDSVTMIKMVPGQFIVTDVTGGPQTLALIHQQIRHYFQDYGRVTMAVPFEYLLTDRQKEKDTSKWTTRIYSPVY